jgi:hypothetical protein
MASIRDWILRCPNFSPPALVASAQKFDRCNSANSLYHPQDALVGFPLAGARFQILSTTNKKNHQRWFFLFGGEGSLPSVSHTGFY